ncbi:transcription initiation factor TFIID subunit 3-like isoform X2 [Liolophura sinensis]|uniref:transcription initiation factor TFIID subunit 3-like isoform X2 n=1 Tax=Liolophura sinensis TaxID=3198878 RepID=UPI0031581A7A
MAAEYCRGILKVCVAQLCQNLGWNAIQSTPLELMTDVLERYLTELGKTTQRYCEQFGRLDPNLDDLGLAFFHLGIPLGELEEYVRHLDPVLFAQDVVSFPVRKSNNFQFPKSREIQQEREEHEPDHLPYMYPGMEAEPGEQNHTPSQPTEDLANSQEDKGTPMEVSPVTTGEKRAVSSPGDGLPSKRMRLSSTNLPEEAGHSQYEMMSVVMSQTGHLTPTRGQGKLPDARTPPPGLCQPISSGEPERRKKDSDRDRDRIKIKEKHRKNLMRSEGERSGSNVNTGHTNEKENLKTRLKPGLLKTFDVKKFSKKDGGKRTGPLKTFKFGKPVFKSSKSKSIANSSSIQEMLFSDPLNMGGQVDGKMKSDQAKQKLKKKYSVDSSQHPELQRLMLSTDGTKPLKGTDTEGERERSAPQSASWEASMVDTSNDSDDELSEDDSPVRRLVIAEADHAPRDTEMRKKERLRRIDDILDSVIRSSMAESDDSSSFSENVDAPKEIAPCVISKIKPKEKEKVKLKMNSGKNTSSLDLDACINTVVRQSAEESNKKDLDSTCTSEKDTCSDRPKIASPTTGNKKQKVKKKLKIKPGKQGKGLNKIREKLKEKIKSRSISQDSSELESENSAKPEKVYPPQFGVFDFPPDSPEESVPLAPLHPPAAPPSHQPSSPVCKPSSPMPTSPEKPAQPAENMQISVDNTPEDSAPAIQPLKLDVSKEKIKHKERSKEKEHKKDRKDKKKDKEKKKKNKDKDREKSKDREKKEKNRDKHDREDKADESAPLTIPKLKLKIGGIPVGGPSSKSVKITNTPVPKDSTPSPDEMKSAPIRPEIPRLVIKPVPRRPPTDAQIKPVGSPPPVKTSAPTPRPAPPPGFKAIPESSPVSSKEETSACPTKASLMVTSPTHAAPTQPSKEEPSKTSGPKPLPTPTPPMLPKFRPIPPVSSSPPPVRNIISPPSPPAPSPPPPPSPAPVKEKVPQKLAPSPSQPPKPSPPPPSPPKPKSPFPSPSPSLTKDEPPKSVEKPKSPSPPRPDPPPIFYPAPPRRTASLSPRSRELPLYSAQPPKRKNSSPRGRKPSSPGRSVTTPPKRKASTTSPGRKKASPKGPKKKASVAAAGKRNLSSPPPSTFAREEEHPSFAPNKSAAKSSQKFSKEDTPSPPGSSNLSPSPSPPPNQKSEQSTLPPPPPPSKPQPLQRAVFAETVGTSADETGQRIWICPTCKLPDDGSPMIGCDRCDEWYHWPCVSILEPPPEDEDWFCPKCKALQAKVKGKGKGAKRGRKKKVK